MKVITLKQNDAGKYSEQIRELYTLCFSDSPGYTDYFIDKKIMGDNGILLFSDEGQLVCMAFISVRHARFFTEEISMPFLYACATHPDHRGQKLMTKVLLLLLTALQEMNLPFVMLHPFDHSFYRRVGFETVDYLYEHTVLREGGAAAEKIGRDRAYEALSGSFMENTSGFDITTSRRPYEFSQKLEELYADGGDLYLFRNQSGGTGYMTVSPDGAEEAQAGFPLSSDLSGIAGLKYLSSLESKILLPNNQIRLTDVSAALSLFSKYLPKSFSLNVFDGQLSKNNGSFLIGGGYCRRLPDNLTEPDAMADVMTLTKLLFGAHRFEGGFHERVFELFPVRNTRFFDIY